MRDVDFRDLVILVGLTMIGAGLWMGIAPWLAIVTVGIILVLVAIVPMFRH